jgi:hypothetical protein
MLGTTPNNNNGAEEAWSRYFRLSLASCCAFVFGSVLYVYLEFIGLDYQKKAASIPQFVKEGDDDAAWYEYGWADDDYVYESPNGNFLLSKYMIVYILAALAFVITGVLEWCVEAGFLSGVLVLAGLTGLTSAILVERNEWLALIFNSISVHLFLIDAVGLFYKHSSSKSGAEIGLATSSTTNISWLYLVLFGDLCWIFGMITDVVLSYYNIFGTYGVRHSYPALGAAFAWLISSLVYLTATVLEELALRKKLAGQEAIPGVKNLSHTEDSDKDSDMAMSA